MVWYKVGAVDEAPGKSGIAHLFEHVMFKETDDLGPEEFTSVVQRNGGQLNAFTSYDYTAYYERVAKDRLELMMTMEADRMGDLIINDDPEGPFISERDVVKEERRQRLDNNPGAILQEQVMSEFFKGHPYEITVIGNMDEVGALTPQDGLDFYKTWYRPNEAILIVAGDVTAEEVRPLAEATYGQLAANEESPTRGWREVSPISETLELEHSDPKVRQPSWDRWYMGTSFIQDPDLAMALTVRLGSRLRLPRARRWMRSKRPSWQKSRKCSRKASPKPRLTAPATRWRPARSISATVRKAWPISMAARWPSAARSTTS